jgi:hypothetical protein
MAMGTLLVPSVGTGLAAGKGMVGTRGGELEVSGAPPEIVNRLWGRHGFSSEEAVPIAHCSDDSTTPVTRSPRTQPVTHPSCVIIVCNNNAKVCVAWGIP